MPDFENIEAYETRERSGKTRISPVAPHSLRPVDYILRPGARRQRTEIPILQPPPTDFKPIDSRDLEREFRAADRAERTESRRRHGGPLTRAWKRLRRYLRTLFSFGGKTKNQRAKGKGGKPARAERGSRGDRKDRRARGGKGGPAGGGSGPGGGADGGKQRPRKPRGRRKGGPDAPGGTGRGRAQAPADKGGGAGNSPGGDGGPPKKRRRNRRNRGSGGGGNPGGQGSSSNSGN